MRQLKPYLSLQPCLHLMTASELTRAREGLNKVFIKRRDSGAVIDGIYKKLREVEDELARRKIIWI